MSYKPTNIGSEDSPEFLEDLLLQEMNSMNAVKHTEHYSSKYQDKCTKELIESCLLSLHDEQYINSHYSVKTYVHKILPKGKKLILTGGFLALHLELKKQEAIISERHRESHEIAKQSLKQSSISNKTAIIIAISTFILGLLSDDLVKLFKSLFQ